MAEEGIAMWRAVGDKRGLAHTLYVLAAVVRGQGDPERASSIGKESLRLFQELGEIWGVLNAIIRLAASAAMHAEPARAARLLGAAESLSETIGVPLTFPLWGADLRQAVDAAHQQMDEAAFEASWTAGRAMSLEDIIAFALSDGKGASAIPKPGDHPHGHPLSRREREIASLIARGLTNRQIAGMLVISELTVDTHVRNILRKLEMSSRAQVASWVTAQGLAAPHAG
jgi:DNA-binding NarL/FixJ family response regulator